MAQDSGHSFEYWFNNCAQLSGQAALHACNQALLINPHDSTTWTNRGQELFQQGQYQAALISNHYALLLKPDFSLGLANQCGILSALGQYSKALEACDLSLIGDGEWGFKGVCLAWNNRGAVLFNLGRYHDALRSYERVLAINPHDQTAIQGCQRIHRMAPNHRPELSPPKTLVISLKWIMTTLLPHINH